MSFILVVTNVLLIYVIVWSNNSFPFWNYSCTKSCNKCPLYADTSADDKTRIRNAAKKAARKVKNKVRVDVNAMLKDPPGAIRRR